MLYIETFLILVFVQTAKMSLTTAAANWGADKKTGSKHMNHGKQTVAAVTAGIHGTQRAVSSNWGKNRLPKSDPNYMSKGQQTFAAIGAFFVGK